MEYIDKMALNKNTVPQAHSLKIDGLMVLSVRTVVMIMDGTQNHQDGMSAQAVIVRLLPYPAPCFTQPSCL